MWARLLSARLYRQSYTLMHNSFILIKGVWPLWLLCGNRLRSEEAMKVKYEDRKCTCCGKVHANSLIMDVREKQDENFIICLSCAKNVHKFVNQMKDDK